MFNSTIEAYSSAIYMLNKINRLTASPKITQAVSDIRCLIENHQQDISHITAILGSLEECMPSKYQGAMTKLISGIRNSPFDDQCLKQRFDNRLNRRFESEMQIQFLLSPTKKVMEAVAEVSQPILNHLNLIARRGDNTTFVDIVEWVKSAYLGFGYDDDLLDVNTMMVILEDNRAEDLSAIMLIHFAYARTLLREHDFIDVAPKRAATGKLAQITQQTFNVDDSATFFDSITAKTTNTFLDTVFFKTHLYSDRGRGDCKDKLNHRATMGLLADDSYFSEGLSRTGYCWYPDARCQSPDWGSAYVNNTLEHDILYIAGPSSMTALLLSSMELLANMDSVEKKQHYLLAIAAQLGAAGYHSLHEVLGPAALGLDLVPGYDMEYANYHQFYLSLMQSDPEFNQSYQDAWANFDNFFHQTYLWNNQDLHELLKDYLHIENYTRPQLPGSNPLLNKSYYDLTALLDEYNGKTAPATFSQA